MSTVRITATFTNEEDGFLPDGDDVGDALAPVAAQYECEYDVEAPEYSDDPRLEQHARSRAARRAQAALDIVLAFRDDDEDVQVNGLDERNRARLLELLTEVLI